MQIIDLKEGEKLTLKNDGFLSLFFVGVGSAFSKLHYQTNLLIIKADTHLLVDCGTLTPMALWKYGCPIVNISNFLITHSHADHIGGLEEAALMGRYVVKKKPNMIITEEYSHILWDMSLKGGIRFNEKHIKGGLVFTDVFHALHPTLVSNTPREYWNIDFENLNIKLFRTKHIPDSVQSWEDAFLSYGIIIDEKILFTSDTQFDPDLIHDFLKLYPTIEFIFHDCQFFKGGVHCSYEELLTFPEEIRKKMYLTHYGDNFANFNPIKDSFLGFAEQGKFYNLIAK